MKRGLSAFQNEQTNTPRKSRILNFYQSNTIRLSARNAPTNLPQGKEVNPP